MAIVVVGGQSRKVGKTSVVAGLIAGLRERRWTAVKITQHPHGSDLAAQGKSWAILEETDRDGHSDTSRFLAAGAEKALWVRTQPGKLEEAMPALRQALAGAENVIIESNNVLEFLRPDIYLTVLDPGNPDFKPSARNFLELASAVILHDMPKSAASSGPVITGKAVFRTRPPDYVTPQIVEFVRARLAEAESARKTI